MLLLNILRTDYVRNKVLDKYSLNNGNIGLVIEDNSTQKRYHIEFRDGYKSPGVENLFGILKEPFSSKAEYLEN